MKSVAPGKSKKDPCGEGWYLVEGQCHKDCEAIGLVNCGLKACAIGKNSCTQGPVKIEQTKLESLRSTLRRIFYLHNLEKLTNGAEIDGIYEQNKVYVDEIANNFRDIKTQYFEEAVIERAVKFSKKYGDYEAALKTVCVNVAKGLMEKLKGKKKSFFKKIFGKKGKKETNFNAEGITKDHMHNGVVPCKDYHTEEARLNCAKAIVETLEGVGIGALMGLKSVSQTGTCKFRY
jgi:hypothetical protein